MANNAFSEIFRQEAAPANLDPALSISLRAFFCILHRREGMATCPFCGLDPYEYVSVGIGSIPVAVTCCQWGYALFADGIPLKEVQRMKGEYLEYLEDGKEELA